MTRLNFEFEEKVSQSHSDTDKMLKLIWDEWYRRKPQLENLILGEIKDFCKYTYKQWRVSHCLMIFLLLSYFNISLQRAFPLFILWIVYFVGLYSATELGNKNYPKDDVK